MASFLTGAAANNISNVASLVIPPLLGLIDDVIHLDRNSQHLQEKLRRMKLLLQDITRPFQHDQRSPPDTVIEWLQRLQDSLQDAKRVMERAQQQKGCLDCFLCREKLMPTQVRQWIANFDKLLIDLERDFSILHNAQEVFSSTPPQPEVFLQPVPKLGYVGSGIKSAQMQVQTWLDNEDRQFRIIGVHGMGGIGKTSLLKTVYNAYKKGKLFQAVIWTTVSGNYNIVDLLSSIAKEINLKLESSVHSESSSAVDMSKRILSARLREMKFLLILDDLWKDLDLQEELGIPLANDKGSRVLISTRSRDVVTRMWADDYSIQIQPLSTDEAWHLFCRGAFRVGTAPTKDIEDVATQIAGQCNGLPLAINVVAAAMKGNNTVQDWHLAFHQLKYVDPHFVGDSGIGEGLYQQLRVSYDRLPHSDIKNCFLSCAAFPEDDHIVVETLVEGWIANGIVNSRDSNNLMDVGYRYVKLLEERSLFETFVNDDDLWALKAHDIVHDVATYIAEKEENSLYRPRQNLRNFPAEQGIHNCKIIAIGYNNISVLPTDFRCPNLLTLSLRRNESLREIPNGFLVNLTSLRVLELGNTEIESLPTSLRHLTQLQLLYLGKTLIKDVPEDICNLSQLQFLYLTAVDSYNRCLVR